MPDRKGETSELDRLRALHEAEQRGLGQPAPAQPAATPAGARPQAGKPAGKGKGAANAKGRGRPRTGARVAAVQALFQSEQSGEPAEAVVSQFQHHRLGTRPGEGGFEEGRVPEADAPLFAAIVIRAARNAEEMDRLITGHLDPGWPLEKLDPVLRALLRAACAEMTDEKAPPAKVVINEYLDVAHGFFGGDEPRFANGVLNALARALRPAEFAGLPRRGG